MKRREFLTLLGGATAGWPQMARAQQAGKIARIGYLASNLTNQSPLEAFRQGLRDLGYDEGRNVVIEYRDAQGKLEPLPALAVELVALQWMLLWPQARLLLWPPSKRPRLFPSSSRPSPIR